MSVFPIMVFAYIIYIIVGGNVTAYPCAVNKETRSSDGMVDMRDLKSLEQ